MNTQKNKVKSIKYGYLVLLIVILAGMIPWSLALMQETEPKIGLTISPLNFEFTANPGDVLENKIKVSNPTDSVISVEMEAEDFSPTGESGHVIVEEMEDITYSLKRWVKATPTNFTLKPDEQKAITFTINVPKNAEPGGKYGSLLASVSGVKGPGMPGFSIIQKVGALILLSVSGRTEEKIEVEEFSAPRFSEFGPINFKIRFENKGTVHVRPRGFVTVTNIFGDKLADVEFSQNNVIPGAIRKIEAKWNERWLLGIRYQATLVGSYGSQNESISAVTTFWAFPWKIGLGILIVLVLIIYFVVRTRRKIKRAEKILEKEEEKKKLQL